MTVCAGSTTEHNAFTIILTNSTDIVNFCPLNSHSVAKRFTSSLDYAISVSICFGCYFAAALILYSIHILVCNRHICSHACPSQLTSGAVDFAVWCEWSGCISRPEWCSVFRLLGWGTFREENLMYLPCTNTWSPLRFSDYALLLIFSYCLFCFTLIAFTISL